MSAVASAAPYADSAYIKIHIVENHNAGFLALDFIAQKLGVSLRKLKFK